MWENRYINKISNRKFNGDDIKSRCKNKKGKLLATLLLAICLGMSFNLTPFFALDKAQAAPPAAPSNVSLAKVGKVLQVTWEASSTPDAKYKVEIYNSEKSIIYSADNLNSDVVNYTFSNVITNNYQTARVYALAEGVSSYAESQTPVFQQLQAINSNSQFLDIGNLTNDAKNAINWMFVYGVTHGYTTKNYQPKNAVTREQMAAFIYRLAGQPKDYNQINPFLDVRDGVFKKAILWGVHNGVISGYNDKQFKPKKAITREQIALLLYRLAGRPDAENQTPSFEDINNLSDEAKKAIAWLNKRSISEGYSKTQFLPNKNLTREQMAQLLKRFSDIMQLCPFINKETKSEPVHFFSTGIGRSSITNLTFINTIPQCNNPVDITDPSLTPGAVLACVYGTDIVVGQAGGVIANPESSYGLFFDIDSPNFNKLDISNFDAFNTAILSFAFAKLTTNQPIVFSEGFGKNTTTMHALMNYSKLGQDIIFPSGFGKNVKELIDTFAYTQIAGNLFLPEDFGQFAESAFNMFEYSKIQGKLTLPNENFGKMISQANDLFQFAEIGSGVKIPEGFAKNATNLFYMFQNSKIKGNVEIPANFAEKVVNSSSLFEKAEIDGDIKIGENFLSSAVYLYNVFSEVDISGKLILPSNFGSEAGCYMAALFSGVEFKQKLELPDGFASNATNLDQAFNGAIFSNGLVIGKDFGKNSQSFSKIFAAASISSVFKLSVGFGEKTTNFVQAFSRISLKTDIDLSEIDFSGKTGVDTRNMFDEAQWNGFFVLVKNQASLDFLTDNTGATAQNVKIKV
ncbi:MAG: S-layer homology domain-containing protein [Bifidobacteriaceae bacterium]|jgi:hypothetical protein|nr:S-layer homology domain-containing protein [Bifidobacteriaceae bacterium]